MAENREYLTAPQANGTLNISEDVVESIVVMAIGEVEGIYGMGTSLSAELLEKIGLRSVGRRVRLSFVEESVTIACDIMMLYGYSVIEVAKAVQERVTTAVESMTGCKVLGVDVNVCGITLPR